MSKEAMKLALEHAKRDERHASHAETRYWCRMYRDIAEKAVEALAEQPAQPQQEPVAITAEQAHEIGAKGATPTEEERLLFEAWMRGHCWAVVGEWDGKTYKHEAETNGWPHPGAMLTRQLWAAWRDRAALTSPPAQRTWVGLTDDEILYCVELENPKAIAEEVEAKLKEKNA